MPIRQILVAIILALFILPIAASARLPWDTVATTVNLSEDSESPDEKKLLQPIQESKSPSVMENPPLPGYGILLIPWADNPLLPGNDNPPVSDDNPSVPGDETPPSPREENPLSPMEESPSSSEEHAMTDSDEEAPSEPSWVTTDRFPTINRLTWDYAVFRNDVMEIIERAERLSGIKTMYGVFVMDLVNNYSCGINENLTRIDPTDNMREGFFNSASVIKLFQGYILCDMIYRGELDIEETYHDPVTGRRFKLLKMIRYMISYSDNNYSNASLRLIGNRKSNEVLERLGIHNSIIYGEMSGAIGYSRKNNLQKYGTVKRCARITPRDTGLILYNIYINRDTDICMETMNKGLLGNIYNSRIPIGVARVNPNYKVAHKTGTNSALGIYNDAGIIYSKRPFILVVFTQSTTEKAGQSFIRSLAEQLTRYFDSKA